MNAVQNNPDEGNNTGNSTGHSPDQHKPDILDGAGAGVSRVSIDYVPTRAAKAAVLSPEEYVQLREHGDLGQVAFTSGGFAPGHPGHFELVAETGRHHGDNTLVCVNGDDFLVRKHGINFMDLETRAEVMSYVIGGDFVVPYELENDGSMNVPLATLQPNIFTKGGDRNAGNIPETPTCEKHNIELISGVGGDFKMASSSDFLRNFAAFVRANPDTFQNIEPKWNGGYLDGAALDAGPLEDSPWLTPPTAGELKALSELRLNDPTSSALIRNAPILSAEQFVALREQVDLGKIVVVAGEFAPMTPFELAELHRHKENNATVVALLASDAHLMRSYEGIAFQDMAMRAQSLSYIAGIDFVIPSIAWNQPNFEGDRILLDADEFHEIDDTGADVNAAKLLHRFAQFIRRNDEAFV
jgi:glycerol-3-phosphate cytidylyltransferase-like family protein